MFIIARWAKGFLSAKLFCRQKCHRLWTGVFMTRFGMRGGDCEFNFTRRCNCYACLTNYLTFDNKEKALSGSVKDAWLIMFDPRLTISFVSKTSLSWMLRMFLNKMLVFLKKGLQLLHSFKWFVRWDGCELDFAFLLCCCKRVFMQLPVWPM